MITCNLTKLESALEQVRKSYPKMKPTDAALLASAITVTGRHAIALYEGEQYRWPGDYESLTAAMVKQVEQVQEGMDTKKTKAAAEEEPVTMNVGLTPDFSAGEALLKGHKDLLTMLSDVMQKGVEFNYSPTDIGWQWALDRTNWNTVAGGELPRKVKVKASFTEGAVGVEMGTTTKKRPSKAKAAVVAEPVAEVAAEVEPAEVVEAIEAAETEA